MSSNVDEQIIRLKLDNSSFASSVSTALGLLDKVRNALTFNGAGKGLDDVQDKVGKFSFGSMANGIDGVSTKFLALSTVAITTLANITNKIVDAGLAMAKSFTTGPIIQGFQDYETQIGSIQTVLANTGLKGADGIKVVNAALDQLNHYADKTIYSFPEMAKNVGTFTAAGVGLDQSVNAIKGVANLAALSGSNSDQASTAMYQLSQAIAANKVGLQDWNSVVNAGMGGQIFKEALFNTGKLKGTLKGVDANTTFDEWTKAGNSFRDSLQDGWITGEVLTDTLSQFTGDLTDAQLSAMGYNADQIKQIQEMAKTANDAATKIKTFTQLKDTLKESVGSAYAGIFRSLFGDIGEATDLFTNLNVGLSKIFVDPVNNLATLVQGFVDLGGREKIIDSFTNAFKFLGAIIAPIKAAFREIFPAATAKDLARIADQILKFTQALKVSDSTADKIKRTFAGVFAIFGIVKTIVFDLATAIFNLSGKVLKGSGSFLDITAKIGDFLVALNNTIKNSGIFFNVFSLLGSAINFVVSLVKVAGSFLAGLFDKINVNKAQDGASALSKISDYIGNLSFSIDGFTNKISSMTSKIGPAVNKVIEMFKKIGAAIEKVFSSQSFDGIISTLQTGLFGALVFYLKKFLSNGLSVDVGGGFFGKLGEALEGVTGQLQAMQMNLKATALLKVAAAIGILAASLLVLSLIKPDDLNRAMLAVALGLAMLVKAMGLMSAMLSGPAAVKIVFAATAITILAAAMLILAGAMLIFSTMSWEDIGKGLAAVTGLLIGLSIAIQPMAAGGPRTILAAASIVILSVALGMLAGVVKLFSMMSWGEMLQGLAGIGIALVGIAGAMYLFPPNMIFIATGLLILSTAMFGIYQAVANFASLSWGDMAKGLVGLAGSLLGIGVAVMLMPPTLPLIALGLIGVSLALGKIQEAVGAFGNMSWGEIAKGLVGLAGSMAILAAGMYLMTGAIAGAVALLIVSAALRVFVPVLQTLSKMSWGDLGKGLGILAAALIGLAILSAILQPFTGAMLALGAALSVVGFAMLLFGAGVALLGVGLGLVAASGGAAITVIIGAVSKLGEVIPQVAVALAKGLVTFLQTITDAAPGIITALMTLLTTFLDAIPGILPSLTTALNALVDTIISIVTTNVPKLVQAGLTLLISLLQGIHDNIGNIVQAAADVVVAFLDSMSQQLPRIIDAGLHLVFSVLEGIAQAAGQVPAEGIKLIGIFLQSLIDSFPGIKDVGGKIINKLTEGLTSLIGNVLSTAQSIGASIINGITGAVGDVVGFAKGIINKLVSGISQLGDLLGKARDIGSGIINGIINGIGDIASAIWNKIKGGLNSALESAKSFLGIGGPSKLWADEIGPGIPLGIAQGIDAHSDVVNNKIEKFGQVTLGSFRDIMNKLGTSIQNRSDFHPTITPILDLSNVERVSRGIDGLVNRAGITPIVNTGQVNRITDDQAVAADARSDAIGTDASGGVNLEFKQYNYSPEALSTIDVYRNTNNSLSLAKRTLAEVGV